MAVKSKRTMNATISRAVESIMQAVSRHAEQRRTYLANPHPWQPERDRHLATLDADRDRAIEAAAAVIDREAESIERDYKRARKTSYDSAEVAEGWRRTREQADAGRGLADVADELESREQAEAIRRNVRSFFTVALGGAGRETVEQAVREILDRVDRAELPLISDRTEQYATERELERRASMRAVEAVGKFVAERRAGIPASASDLLRLGYSLSDEGFEPTPAADDPGRRAEAQRNSLPPELRDALDSNARRVGFASTAPAEPPLDLGS